MKILSELFSTKNKKDELRRENQQNKAHNQILYDIKDIFLDSFFVDNLDDNDPIVDKLIKIVKKLTNPEIDTNEMLTQ